MVSNFSGYLFASPSWLEGIARLLDLRGSMQQYNESANAKEADSLAIASDWLVVGEDLQTALDQQAALKPQLTESILCNASVILAAAEELVFP